MAIFMRNASDGLLRTLRDFFERELIGVVRWGNVTISAGPNDRIGADGKPETDDGVPRGHWAQAAFGPMPPTIVRVESTEMAPPLGRATLRLPGSDPRGEPDDSGPIDRVTWIRFGALLRFIASLERVYKLKPGEDWALYNGRVIVAGGDEHPRIIHPDGRIEVIEPSKEPANVD